MKKTLLTISLAIVTAMAFCHVANAATVTYTKPSVTVNTSQEESVVSKKLKEIENKKAEAKAKKEANKKEAEEKKAAVKSDIEKAKKDVKSKVDTAKSDIENAKKDAKEKQEANKKQAEEKKKQRQDAINSFKNSFKN